MQCYGFGVWKYSRSLNVCEHHWQTMFLKFKYYKKWHPSLDKAICIFFFNAKSIWGKWNVLLPVYQSPESNVLHKNVIFFLFFLLLFVFRRHSNIMHSINCSSSLILKPTVVPTFSKNVFMFVLFGSNEENFVNIFQEVFVYIL